MWLVYLRFRGVPVDDLDDGVRTYHVRADNREEAEAVVAKAERHGLSPSAHLVEHALLYSDRLIKPKGGRFDYLRREDFLRRWEEAEGGPPGDV